MRSEGVLWVTLSALTADVVLLGCVCHRVLHEAADRPLTAILGGPETMAPSFPVRDSIAVPLVLTATYLAALGCARRWMRGRPPVPVEGPMRVYNLYQMVVNGCLVLGFLHTVHSTGMRYWGAGVDPSPRGRPLGVLLYAHHRNKYVAFADSLFMVLRRRDRQHRFLHVFHHAVMPWSSFAVVRWAPGGDAWFGACCNSAIHLLMHTHYLLTSYRWPCPWKRALTRLQMLQFVVCFAHSVYVWCADRYPRRLVVLQAAVMLGLFALFARFYATTYHRGPAAVRR